MTRGYGPRDPCHQQPARRRKGVGQTAAAAPAMANEPSILNLGKPHRAPTRAEVEALMKRCQIGVGGRNALDDAHSIMAECYGMLDLLMLCLEREQSERIALRQLWGEAEAENATLRGPA